MRALRLDFVRVRRPASAIGLALFVAGCLVGGVLFNEALDAREDLDELVAWQAQAERRVRAQRAASAPAAPANPQEAPALGDARQIIARLNTPWPRLLGDTAAAAGSEVSLTGLNPDTQSRGVRISGVAADLAAVYAFVTRMQAHAGFEQVHLAQHEVARDAAGAPRVAFVVAAQWKEAL